jgi:hypothetical protein
MNEDKMLGCRLARKVAQLCNGSIQGAAQLGDITVTQTLTVNKSRK